MLEAVQALLEDPPPVHGSDPNAGRGVWSTDADCYDFLWLNTQPGDRTLETGCGVSTAVFAARKTHHVSVFLDETEGQIFTAWAAERGVDISRIDLHAGSSEHVLPALVLPELDLVFIDGNHGFPAPILDWFYSCSHLRQGGVVVVDDIPIPGVQRLAEYLDQDARWQPIERHPKWHAYRRLGSGHLGEDHLKQEFLPGVRATDVSRIFRTREMVHRWKVSLLREGRK